MSERNDRFAPRHKLIYFKYYTFYRERKKKARLSKKYWVKDRAELFRITDKICEVVSRELINRQGGVAMENWGYFCNWMPARKQFFNVYRKGKQAKMMVNFHTGGHVYLPQLFCSMLKGNPFRGWSMDRGFSRDYKKKLSDKLKQGKKYKMYYSIAKRILSNKTLKEI
jgi:hypothetical protein